MEELERLCEAAEINVVAQMSQKLEKKNKAHYIGKGKVEELKLMCENMEINMVVFNDELSGLQLRNLQDTLEGVIILDRTMLILDIFASRAVSKEGRLQVELAQLQYRLPRLLGFGKSLAKMSGSGNRGPGNRGPGEKKLETDRRHIAKRMDEISKEINEVRHYRGVQRAKRQKAEIPVVALVGYTNSGKSAIMNRILLETNKTEKDVFVENMLFATLDTFQRNIKLEGKEEFVLIDTVGFVSKLPHALIRAFKATLEEVVFADLLIHVVDASFSNHEFHLNVTKSVLGELGAFDKQTLTVYNKIDLLGDYSDKIPIGEDIVPISAITGENIGLLIEKIRNVIFSENIAIRLLIPYTRGDLNSYICEKCSVIKMEHTGEGTYFEAMAGMADRSRLEEYII